MDEYVIKDFEISTQGKGVHKYLQIKGDVIIQRDGQLFLVNITQSYDPTNSAKKLMSYISEFNKTAKDVTEKWIVRDVGQANTEEFNF